LVLYRCQVLQVLILYSCSIGCASINFHLDYFNFVFYQKNLSQVYLFYDVCIYMASKYYNWYRAFYHICICVWLFDTLYEEVGLILCICVWLFDTLYEEVGLILCICVWLFDTLYEEVGLILCICVWLFDTLCINIIFLDTSLFMTASRE
jgi:hypothetical protein